MVTIDEQLEQLAHLECPRQVDVTDRVMSQVMQHPYLQTQQNRQVSSHAPVWRRIGIVAAAAVATILIVNVASLYTRSYDEEGMGSMIAQVNDYSSWNAVEEAAVNPIECLYEE